MFKPYNFLKNTPPQLVYLVLSAILLLAFLVAVLLFSHQAKAQTKTGVEQTQVFLHRNRQLTKLVCLPDRDNNIECEINIQAQTKSVVYVKNHDKSGGDCHTYHKIANVVNVHRDGDTTKPIISRQIWYQNGQSATYVPDPDGDGVVDNPYNGTFAEVYFGHITAPTLKNDKMRRWICVPFGKKRRVANKYTGDLFGGGTFIHKNGWLISEKRIRPAGLQFDLMALDSNGSVLANINYPVINKETGIADWSKVQMPTNTATVCAFKYPNIKDGMKDMPVKVCLDGLSTPPAPVVYRCYVGMTQGDVSSVAPHSSNITIKAGSIVHEHHPNKKYNYNNARKQTTEIAISKGGCNTYADGTSDYPAYASGIWKIYSYEYTNN